MYPLRARLQLGTTGGTTFVGHKKPNKINSLITVTTVTTRFLLPKSSDSRNEFQPSLCLLPRRGRQPVIKHLERTNEAHCSAVKRADYLTYRLAGPFPRVSLNPRLNGVTLDFSTIPNTGNAARTVSAT